MAEHDITQEDSNVITGGDKYLLYRLKKSLLKADKVDIIVSFLMESGVKLILDDIKCAADKGVRIRILTGDYLGITEPGALYLIKNELKGKVDIRMFNDKKRSFHPKAYIFHNEKESEIYIGSSNVSKSALTLGIEWNYRLERKIDKDNFDIFCDSFNDLFYNHSIILDDDVLKEYANNWKRPSVYKDIEKYNIYVDETSQYMPRGAQIEALYALKSTREEGADKALIYAATGVGKTYLAAFDSVNYEKVLFVAHREEILKQAANSFINVRSYCNYGFFTGKIKDIDKDIVFASVSSLGKTSFLKENYFPADYFDYIIVDEFHHAVANQYKRILEYFKPKFMLGLTATPERMDGRSIYALCDYNVPYQISLKDAINKGYLVPFRYYGIYDETVDYNSIHRINGKYIESELEEKLLIQKRYDLIYKHYKKYKTKRALGFCSTRQHAESMAKEFSTRGIPSVAVYSNSEGEFSVDRQIAVDKLSEGSINIIFSVDMFNEGLDICSVDMVMFLRPTESPIVFLQQLGRGLRTDRNKEFLTVLDFIGNYEKAGNAPFLLSGIPYSKEAALTGFMQDFEFPEGCIVDFDLRLIDLFREMAKRDITVKDRILCEYNRIKNLLDNKVPSRNDLFNNMDGDIFDLCLNYPKLNPFKDYLAFLNDLGDLTDEEKIFSCIGREFLNTLENTSMTKSYKMPILLAFYNDGNIKTDLTEDDIYRSCVKFYSTGANKVDLEKDKSSRGYIAWSKDKYIKEAKKNPVHFLIKSGNGFFIEKQGFVISLCDQLKDIINNSSFISHMKDIIDYRTVNYYRNKYYKNNKGSP